MIEMLWLSIITYEDCAKVLHPLTEISLINVEPIILSPNQNSNFNDAVSLLAKRINLETTKTTFDQKGDWKPYVIFLSSSIPSLSEKIVEIKERIDSIKFSDVVLFFPSNTSLDDNKKLITENIFEINDKIIESLNEIDFLNLRKPYEGFHPNIKKTISNIDLPLPPGGTFLI